MGAQIYREMREEVGVTHDYHIREIVPGWVNGMSTREGNYSLTASFVTQLKLSEKEIAEWFKDWKAAQDKWMASAKAEGVIAKTEFKDIMLEPNQTS